MVVGRLYEVSFHISTGTQKLGRIEISARLLRDWLGQLGQSDGARHCLLNLGDPFFVYGLVRALRRGIQSRLCIRSFSSPWSLTQPSAMPQFWEFG